MRWCSRAVVWVQSQGAPETVLPSSRSGPVWGPNGLCPPTMSSANWPKGRMSVEGWPESGWARSHEEGNFSRSPCLEA